MTEIPTNMNAISSVWKDEYVIVGRIFKNIIVENQHGFIRYHSTVTNLLVYTNFVDTAGSEIWGVCMYDLV